VTVCRRTTRNLRVNYIVVHRVISTSIDCIIQMSEEKKNDSHNNNMSHCAWTACETAVYTVRGERCFAINKSRVMTSSKTKTALIDTLQLLSMTISYLSTKYYILQFWYDNMLHTHTYLRRRRRRHTCCRIPPVVGTVVLYKLDEFIFLIKNRKSRINIKLWQIKWILTAGVIW